MIYRKTSDYIQTHTTCMHTFADNASACTEIVDKCVCACVCLLGGSGSQLVITHLAFSGLIVGDDHVVLITCSITANVNKGLHWRPVTLPV